LIMSEFTFNIADYRSLSRVRTHDRGPAAKARNGFVVLSANSETREYEWFETKPVVVDIRSVREARHAYPRHGKVLRFSNSGSHRVYMMPAHDKTGSWDDDPGPVVA